jgi:3-phosphoinositide dependent protein kinase-1
MLSVDVSTLPPGDLTFPPTLADLSRTASVISTSSSSESLHFPRPKRNFSSPRTQSPHAPSPRALKPPPHLTRELGLSDGTHAALLADSEPPVAPARLKSRNPSLNGRLTADDFKFGATIGEGSYSTVRSFIPLNLVVLISLPSIGDARYLPCYWTGVCHQGIGQGSLDS